MDSQKMVQWWTLTIFGLAYYKDMINNFYFNYKMLSWLLQRIKPLLPIIAS